MTSVAVLGGGVGGLSAAHELAERGFDVTVYEMREAFGGKARSMDVPGSGKGGRKDLPGEHGFRFFPGFYRHLTHTMKRIPCREKTVLDNLTDATEMLLAQSGRRNEVVMPARMPTTADDLVALTKSAWDSAFSQPVPPWEMAFFLERLFTLLTSCDERRYQQWELMSWWEFTGAEKRSSAFQKFLADGLTRTLVAAQAQHMSARTGGLIMCQLLFDLMRVDGHVDRVLNAPTSEAWIDPWTTYLQSMGVDLRGGSKVTAIHCENRRISGVTVRRKGRRVDVAADYYIAALPVEQLDPLIAPELKAADPSLAKLKRLITRWMNGVLFYLDRDVELAHGHAIFIDSEWSLTAISQNQFWPGVDLERRGNGKVKGILSVDISEWYRPGKRTGKRAVECDLDEIRAEVWGQLLDHLDDGELEQANIIDCFLDPAIEFPNPSEVTNCEPLLINTAGSWHDRPPAVTAIDNFLLAADFVQTHTDLATMEGANEAARRAVNGILAKTDPDAKPCKVWPLIEPDRLKPLRAADAVRWRVEQQVKSVVNGGRDVAAGLVRLLPLGLAARTPTVRPEQ